MFAIIAAILFGIAVLLRFVDSSAWVTTFMLLGLLAMALHMALGTGVPWRRSP